MPPKSRRLLQRQSRREDAQSLSPTPQPPLPPLSNTTTDGQSLSPSPPRPLRNTTTTAHSVTPPPPPPLSNTTTSQSLSHPAPHPPRNTTTTAHSVTPPPHPPLSNTTTAQSSSHPPPPPPRNTTTAQSLSPPPPPPPLLNTTLVDSSSTAGGEAPAATLRSIRCKNAEDGGVAPKRRMVVSDKTKRIVKTTVAKIKPAWSELHLGPDDQAHRTLLSRDIGTAVRTHVPMLAPTFLELEPHHKETVEKYLKNLYDIPKSNVYIWDFIDEKCQARYSDWKYECHQHFLEFGDDLTLEFSHRPEQRDYLVNNEFRDKKKIVISARNKENRNKNPKPINHHSGAKPLSHRAEDFKKKGHLLPLCAAVVEVYLPSKYGREKAVNLQSEADEFLQAREESDPMNVQPIPLENELELVKNSFGEGKGTTVRGAGPFKRAAKRRGGARNFVTQEVEDDRQEMRELVKSSMEENQALKKRLEAMETEMREMQNFVTAQVGSI